MKIICAMKFVIFCISLLLSSALYAQKKLAGTVKSALGEPLVGANVFIKGSYDGAITDTGGKFSMPYPLNDSAILRISYIGFETIDFPLIKISDKLPIVIVLKENSSALEEVVITAGAFEAGEKKRAVLLTPIEIATTASSDGDVYGALKTFPGVQKQGETGKIIVRGGDNYESKTYIDGMLVSTPYTSSMPDLPARGRFSPFMFNGVMFSTGGYSAEYGQALSSVLELQTPGLFEEDITSVSLMNVGAAFSRTKVSSRMACSAEASYNNLYPYFLMAKHELDWIEVPQSFGGNVYYRLKTGKTGMLKADITGSHSHSLLDYSNLNSPYEKIGLTNSNLYVKSNYITNLNDKWLLKCGLAYNLNTDDKELDSDKLQEKLNTFHARIGLIRYYNDKTTLKFGVESYSLASGFEYVADTMPFAYKKATTDVLSAAYVETDLRLTKKTALRIGGRGEYSTITGDFTLAPRISVARKLYKSGQLSFAYGNYYQQPEPEYFYYCYKPKSENARHFIVNYQYQKGGRVLRTEVYLKQYDNLINYTPSENHNYSSITNNGFGYAKGFDIFWKDNQTFKYADYWISYSYIDSKRFYKNYIAEATPDYVSNHNFSLVLKYWFSQLNTQACLTYNYASGRPYFNPNNTEFMADRTRAFHDISANLSYITNLFGYFTVVHLAVGNIAGTKNTYSYNYSTVPDSNGEYQRNPVSSLVQRTIIIGVFISIK